MTVPPGRPGASLIGRFASCVDDGHLPGDGGQAQEDVLQALTPGPQVSEGQVPLGKPCRDGSHVGG